jgi:nitroreductase
MKVGELVLKNRSYRRFYENFPIEDETLRQLVDLARLTGSASNLQPLKYLLSVDHKRNNSIFPHLRWAGYLKDWNGPEEGERPSGYIIILGDKNITRSFGCDHGIAAQSILLGASEMGLGGCMIGSIEKEDLRRELSIPSHLEILLVLAIGKPKEIVKIENIGPEGDVKYWRDAKGIHHVPKRSLDEIIIVWNQ